MSFNYVRNENLTQVQQDLKWYLYCEVELGYNLQDIKVVLEDLLQDVNNVYDELELSFIKE